MKNPEKTPLLFYSVMWDDQRYASLIPKISDDANKYTRGSLAVVGGSAHYTGAPILAAQASARTGTGYTTLIVPSSMEQVARSHLLSIPVIGVGKASDDRFDGLSEAIDPEATIRVLSQLGHLDAVLAGPGMGRSQHTVETIRSLLLEIEVPLVIDADGLNAIAGFSNRRRQKASTGEFLQGASVNRPEQEASTSLISELSLRSAKNLQTVLTPHDGELTRLANACRRAGFEGAGGNIIGATQRELDAVLINSATGAVVVAKGPQTLIVTQGRILDCSYGTPALAKAGTGDVLAGIIASYLAQGLGDFEAAALGTRIHGEAGLVAEEHLGTASVMAEDVIDAIPLAIAYLKKPTAD